MTSIRCLSYTFAAIALLATALPAAAQRSNLSDITGPNISDITGPNISDVTGPNVSDITGTDTNSSAVTQSRANELADDLGSAFQTCSSTGDCGAVFTLMDQASAVIEQSNAAAAQ